jgi:hypothetical protein
METEGRVPVHSSGDAETEDEEQREDAADWAAPCRARSFSQLPQLALVNTHPACRWTRAYAVEAVCPAWREALWDDTLWTRFDLSAPAQSTAQPS